MTERDIQKAIYWYRIQNSPIMLPNIYLFEWESDMLCLTHSRHVYEYEIKLTHSDFLADAKKIDKHTFLEKSRYGPKRFYYVCPTDIISVNEVPKYSGLIYVNPSTYEWQTNTVKIIKPAYNRKVPKLTNKQIYLLLQKFNNKFWNLINKMDKC
jgi:hypothetical protein